MIIILNLELQHNSDKIKKTFYKASYSISKMLMMANKNNVSYADNLIYHNFDLHHQCLLKHTTMTITTFYDYFNQHVTRADHPYETSSQHPNNATTILHLTNQYLQTLQGLFVVPINHLHTKQEELSVTSLLQEYS